MGLILFCQVHREGSTGASMVPGRKRCRRYCLLLPKYLNALRSLAIQPPVISLSLASRDGTHRVRDAQAWEIVMTQSSAPIEAVPRQVL